MNAIAPKLASILQAENSIYEWEIEVGAHSTALRERVKRAIAPDIRPKYIVYPHTQAELAEVVTCAYHNNWPILPCGRGSKLSWGGLVAGVQLVVSTERLNQLIFHAVGDLTVTVAAGMRFSELQTTLAKTGQFLALDPTAPTEATIGGIVATASTGSLRQRYGGVRDQLLGITCVRADGQVAKAGGQVVKNVAGYDLMKLFTGSYGTLGIISQVTFRVYPLPEASQTVVLTGPADAMAVAVSTLRASALTPVKADVLSTQLVSHLGLGQGLGLLACFASVTESVKQQSERLLEVGQQLNLAGTIYSATDEADLWQRLREQMEAAPTEQVITGKIGVLPAKAIATLTQLDSIAGQGMGLIHTTSGLGLLRLDTVGTSGTPILEIRRECESQGGFLTLLEAPTSLKQQIDVWGYSGNALDLMRLIKQQFDSKNILSPHRFVGGI